MDNVINNNLEYEFLGVPENASDDLIKTAYKNKLADIYVEYRDGKITKEQYQQLYTGLTEVRDRLLSPVIRASIDQAIANKRNGQAQANGLGNALGATGAHVAGGNGRTRQDNDDEYDDEYEDDNTQHRGRRWLKVALITGAVVAALACATFVGPKIYQSIIKADAGSIVGVVAPGDQADVANSGIVSGDPAESEEPEQVQTQGEGQTQGQGEGQTQGEGEGQTQGEGEGQTQDEGQVNVDVKNYGDIKNAALVSERAEKLYEEITKAGMTNLSTGLPYAKEEIETLILYVNGEYVPETEEEAFNLYTEYLNFICASINIDHTLIQSAYLGGEESFKATVEGFVKDQQRPDIVSAFTFGDSYAAPYLYWLQEQYYDMRYTTDREEATRIFNEVFQSFADIMKGDGFTLNGVTYTEANILGLDKVCVSNLCILFGLNAEVFRTTNTADTFQVTNKLISADPEMQKDTATFDEVSAWLNGACETSLIAVDDQGLPLITSGEGGRSLGELSQINTVYQARENFLLANTQTLSK